MVRVGLLVAFVLLGAFSVEAAEPIRFEFSGEKIEIKTDGRKWEEGFRDDAGTKGLVEYVIAGETVKDWSELVTVNYFQGLEGADLMDRFVTFTKQGLYKQCGAVKWEDLATKKDGVIYAWTAQQCQGGWPDQTEVARVIKGKKGLYVLHYATKKVPMPKENRSAWFSLLGKADIKSPS
jgi:hypothetical protein